MINLLELLIAYRFIRSKRKDSFISVVSLFSLIGMILGVSTLIIVMSIMNGYHKEFVKNILGIQGHITIVKPNNKFTDYVDFSDKIERIKQVEFAAPIIIEQSLFVAGNKASGGFVRGIEPEKLGLKLLLKDAINTDALDRFKNHEGVIVGINLADQLKLSIDDTIKIVTTESSSTFIGNIPRSKSFKVIGFFDVGLYQYNSTTIFMDLAAAQTLYKFPEAVGEIEVMLDDTKYISQVKQQISKLSQDHIKVIDWESAQDKWLNALKTERNVMFLILILIILVAVFNIISSLIMLVKDKTKSIAILRTMGLSQSSLIKIFIICGSMIGFIGSMGGVALGSLLAFNIDNIKIYLEKFTGNVLFDPMIYFLTHLPSDINITDICLIFSISFGFSIIATIYPAYRATTILPAEVLRYE